VREEGSLYDFSQTAVDEIKNKRKIRLRK